MNNLTALNLQLLKQKVPMLDLTIEQAMSIAKIPERFNEKRISALITYTTGDSALADTLTMQERYYVLLNQQALSHNKYALEDDFSDYYIDTIESEVPDEYFDKDIGIGVQHIRGGHICLLETICEDLFDWTCGLMACQLYGDLSALLGGEGIVWDQLDAQMPSNELNQHVQSRVRLIGQLNELAFNNLSETFDYLVAPLTHYLETSIDNNGITVLKEVNGDYQPARFPALSHLQGHAKQLARYIA
ncbi:hypothetical protein [Psychrobacter sp.]|uniref:hypothetical protein n=1 Tax=Psychrobacter sp. TaxID=56811 RepID=UPI0025DBF304|nr:hypothetical protein [Psychrobacter sp.]